MEFYLEYSILSKIYSYLRWYELRNFENVPEKFWRHILCCHCRDIEFRDNFCKVWKRKSTKMFIDKTIFLCYTGVLSAKHLFLYYINSLLNLLQDTTYNTNQIVPSILLSDRDFIFLAVCRNILILNTVPDFIRRDERIIYKAITYNFNALKYAHSTLTSNRNFILKAVKVSGGVLYYASNNLKADFEIVITAVQSYGLAIKFANPVLRANKKIALVAIKSLAIQRCPTIY